MNQVISKPEIKVRESNFELLRIIAMFMVLILHADFQALGAPTRADIISSPIASMLKVFFEMASIVAVNVFILISGWFGIRPSIKGFCKFVFQCLFFSVGIYAVMIAFGFADLSVKGIAKCFALMPDGHYWFITSYIGLFLFSPVLNAFIAAADKKTFIYVLLGFYTFQTIYAFIGGGADYLMKGYSAMSFMGLYLLAAFLRTHLDLNKYNKNLFIVGYISTTILLTITWILSQYIDLGPIVARMLAYSNPMVIFSSVCIMAYFSRINFSSSIVNRIAASCFAAYLLHCNPNLYSSFLSSIETMANSNSFIALRVIGVICAWYVVALILDLFRVTLWNWMSCLRKSS